MEFPKRFLFGAATSAHQVEGNNIHSDWWAWEQSTSGVHQSGKAADHWNRFREDFALAKNLGHTAHRLSIEWSRIEPRPGEFNKKALEHYREVLLELRKQNIKSFVTLHHFTNPEWLAQKGGWETGYAVERFEIYVRYVSQQLGELVDFWVTINEPMVYASQSYWRVKWPPQKRSLISMMRVIGNLAKAHRSVYRILKMVHPNIPVGFAKHLVAYIPEHAKRLDSQMFVKIKDWWFNKRFFSLTRGAYDFIGVNYYFPGINWQTWHGPKSDLGWPVYPEGLTHVLKGMKRYKKPIYITENGIADADDSRRADFIREHIRAVRDAIAQGVDVRGYLHWSLLDNFEWADGFAPRFGLIEVDYSTMERTVRPSAYVLKAFTEHV